jgi:hypothetical protein
MLLEDAMESKIRFNPVSKEVEIEGTEAFVEKYFQQIKDLFVSFNETAVETARASKKAKEKPLEKKLANRPKRGEIFTTVIDTIKASNQGMNITDLMKATGFAKQQVTSVLYRAKKEGIIRTVKRGVYIAASPGSYTNPAPIKQNGHSRHSSNELKALTSHVNKDVIYNHV